ncbi:MAG: EAL domain-containing protein [Motiliproteus sp.]
MQFRHKIILMTLLLFSLLLTTVYVVQFNHTRAYLAKQMSVDVGNTLNSLGLSLIPYLKNNEPVAAETTINAVFDGGSYQQIELRLLADGSLLQRQQSDHIVGVPAWFIELQLFEPVSQSNMLTSGWLQLGELKVVADTAYANEQLWKLSSQIMLWFSAVAAVVMVLLLYFMRRLFGPLRAIETQVNAISEQKFGQPLPEPELKELQSLVRSFNSMSLRLQNLFQHQADETEKLRQAAFQDELTRLGNRIFFEAEMEQWMAEPGEGGLVFVRLYHLKTIAQQQGYAIRDQLVCNVAELLSAPRSGSLPVVAARMSDNEFALLLPGFDSDQVNDLLQLLGSQLEQQLQPLCQLADDSFYAIGAAMRNEGTATGELLARTDSSLQEARLDNTCSVKLLRGDREQPALGRNRWRELILGAIDANQVSFELQPVLAADGSRVSSELFSLIEHQSIRYPAGQFMPFVDQYALGAQFDRHVIESVAPYVDSQPVPVVVNLSETAIGDVGFINWLEQFFLQQPSLHQQLHFELPETALASQHAELDMLCSIMRRLNIRFGFDRISQHLEKFQPMAELGPAYLKVDRSLVLNSAAGDNGFIRSLVRLAHEVEIELVVLRVEDEEQLELLAEYSVDGYQGYISKPLSWLPGAE